MTSIFRICRDSKLTDNLAFHAARKASSGIARSGGARHPCPWEKGIRGKGYPEKPIVERSKERTLQAYKLAKGEMTT